MQHIRDLKQETSSFVGIFMTSWNFVLSWIKFQPQEDRKSSQHDWKYMNWDVKNQHKQIKALTTEIFHLVSKWNLIFSLFFVKCCYSSRN